LNQQPFASQEMALISVEGNTQIPASNGFYAYDKTAGKDSTVYIIDTGANEVHPVSKNPAH
jgi:hypothetical protein